MDLSRFKSDSVIADLILKHNISDEQLDEAFFLLFEYMQERGNCQYEPMENCKQRPQGWNSELIFENGSFYVRVIHCKHWLYENKNEKIKQQFKYIDYDIDAFDMQPKEYFADVEQNADFSEKEVNDRKVILNDAAVRIKNGIGKGLYLYGDPGIGKTTIMKVIANASARMQKTVFFANLSNLINEIKEDFARSKKDKYSRIVFNLKTVDVLILDDIGGETVSAWSRDDLLTSVLNYRMEHRKITFFTSNLSPDQLLNHYVSDKIPNNTIMKKRFLERIRGVSVAHQMEGQNHRN